MSGSFSGQAAIITGGRRIGAAIRKVIGTYEA